MAAAEPVVTELTIDATGAEQGQQRYVRAMASAQAAATRMTEVSARLWQSNDEVARSYDAVNDNIRDAGKSALSAGVEFATTANHLKIAALAAYAWSPAFRAMVNPALVATIRTLGPAAVAAGAAIVSAISPALAFISRLSLPILAVVAAWKLLTATIGQGADMLEKYGNAGRALDSPNLAANLATLTKLQPKDGNVTAAQAREAAELNGRLDQAKFKLGQALETQLNLNAAALLLQNIWVNIVEKVAEYAQRASTLGPADNGLEQAIKDTGYQATGKADIDDGFAAMRDARRKLSAGLGIRAAGAGDDENIGGTFAARFNAALDGLSGRAEKVKETATATISEFDRLERSLERQAAAQEAESKAVGASVGEHARLRAEMRLQEAVMQDGKNLDDYAERIKRISDRLGEAAQKAAELRLQSDIKFEGSQIGRTDSEQGVASRLRSVYGDGFESEMNGALANQMRFNEGLRTTKDMSIEAATGFAREWRQSGNAIDAATNALTRMQDRLIDMALNKAISGLFGGGFNLGSLFQAQGGNYGLGQSLTGSTGMVAGGVHSGGTIGLNPSFTRVVHPAYFDDAPRLHGGGDINWAAGERPVIGLTGERMLNRQETANYGKASQPIIIVNSYGAEVSDAKTNDEGDTELTVRAITRDEMASPRTNGIQRSKYGQSPRMRARV